MKKLSKILSILLAVMLTVGLVQTAFVQASAEEAETEVVDIEIVQAPDKTAYKESTYFDYDIIDLSGLQINVKYSDNSGCVYSFDEPNGSHYNNSFGCRFENEEGEGEIFYVGLAGDDEADESYYLIQPGENKVFVRLDSGDYYETSDDYYAYFTVTGYEPEVEKIEITSLPSKTEFEDGEYIDFTGLCYNVYFSDGSTQYFDGWEGDPNYFTSSKYNDDGRLVVGENTVKIFYGDYEDVYDTFTITVRESAREKDDSIESVKITKLPDKLTYVRGYETLSMLGSEITVYYKDKTTQKIIPDDFGLYGSPENLNSLNYYDKQGDQYLGKGKVTVEYGGYTDDFEVDWIENNVAEIKITKKPDMTVNVSDIAADNAEEYYKKASSAAMKIEENMKGAEIAVTYKDGSTDTYTFGMPIGYYKLGMKYIINGFNAYVSAEIMEFDEIMSFDDVNIQGEVYYLGARCSFSPMSVGSNNGDEENTSNTLPSDTTVAESTKPSDDYAAASENASNDSSNAGGTDNSTVQTGQASMAIVALLVLIAAIGAMIVLRKRNDII